MLEFVSEDLMGSRFQRVNLADSLFRLAEFRGAEFRGCELADTWFRVIEMSGVTMRGVELNDVEISGDVGNLKINGVEVREPVEAELDRRYPERAVMRPADAAGFRRAWEVIGRLWDGTVDRARRLDPDLLHESVDGEWSFIQTLRHATWTPCNRTSDAPASKLSVFGQSPSWPSSPGTRSLAGAVP
jgi:uncharacterized protein YjbI with pentapeptide repeats